MDTKLQTTWTDYTAAWNASDAEKMQTLFAKCLTIDCVYRDPIVTATGWDELSSYIGQLHESIPGAQLITRKSFGMTPIEYRKIGDRALFLKKVELNSDYIRHINTNLCQQLK